MLGAPYRRLESHLPAALAGIIIKRSGLHRSNLFPLPRLVTFFRQSHRRRSLVLEAIFELFRAWALVRLRPFKSYSAKLGVANRGEVREKAEPDLPLCRDVRWAIGAVDRTFGGRFTCLMQGMAGKAMLNRRGVANTLVLGARLKSDETSANLGGMAAHAWLCAGSVVLIGGEARAGFVPVTSYHSP